MPIAGVAVLPTIILGVNVTTVTTFSLKNVVTNHYTDNTTVDAYICVQSGTNAIARVIRVFV
ncbi:MULTISPECIES: DUF3172 domain-containing protein [Nostoc]|uniref:DUF3172 domain-containing protein n=1 Tax=Nostoc paludosum FACHB-159 TaxID=2692908 RepID=A0ABR8KFV4_9NOSO|nr:MULTISPECIES: DUF3172 domain-containing protein [Nostoc]MBD2680720.1 DUF3172 domain-containing protein [Nostoc sp. FACHB-857]MBD2737175.1 DUF3172 domain-containing protein [Nostoc paludosum FACHB-159]